MASSDGIGKAIACSLAREGVHVMMCGRDEAKLAAAMEEAKAAARDGAQVAGERVDLGTPHGPALLVEAAATAFGGLDILVTNTGGPPAGPLLGFDDEAWQSAFESVLLSVARGARAAEPYLAASEQGRIVAIASSSIKFSLSGLGFSNVFRPGINGLVKTLAEELGPKGITVNLIAPGKIDTARVRWLDDKRAERTGCEPGRGAGRLRARHPARPLRRAGRARRGRGLPLLEGRAATCRDGHAGRRRPRAGALGA